MDLYFYVKSLHLIFVVTWFAGLFYIPRLFVYQIEAYHEQSPKKEILGKQLGLMAKRLWYIITWPSAILTTVFAIWLLILNPSLLNFDWMIVKLVFVALLFIYHFKTHQIYKQLQNEDVRYTSKFMRIWNEGATIALFAIIFLAVLKDSLDWVFGVVGLVVLAILLMLGIRWYKKVQERNPEA